ncbi:hypothetical protein QFC19_008169 [Naganishia cerealis]|uniref:Uncharacterized protein n=1 Tax=Naganishia cerealis TaxID=610337 RepID=A0ACC2V3V6_9TREE|nr:hypothetical protein QFC19_008169 [Naganishia cerealis]
MQSQDGAPAATNPHQPNKRIRLSESSPRPTVEHTAKDSKPTVAEGSPAEYGAVQSSVAAQSHTATNPLHASPNHVANGSKPAVSGPSSTASAALPRVKLEDVASAQQQQQSSRSSSSQAALNGKQIPSSSNMGHMAQYKHGPSTPTSTGTNGIVPRSNSMLTTHTSRYVYPAAATPVMSRTPSAGQGVPNSQPSTPFSQSIPPRVQHPQMVGTPQGPQGRFIPPLTGLRTPGTPGTAFSPASGMMTGRSVMNAQAMPNRASPLSAGMPSSVTGIKNGSTLSSRATTPSQNYTMNQQPLVVLPRRKRQLTDEKTILESERFLKQMLEMDQKATTQNFLSDEPFRDAREVVDKLLPFHIWQVHDEDLDIQQKSKARKVAERQQIMQMATKKIELERRIRALRVRGDENQHNLGYVQAHNLLLPDLKDIQARAQGVIRNAQMENERLVHDYRRRNADMLRQHDEARRYAENASKRNTPDLSRPAVQTSARPPSGVSASDPTKAHVLAVNATRPTPWTPANTSKPVDIRVPMNMLPQLTGLNIIRAPKTENIPSTLLPPPATIVRTAEDLSHIVISVVGQTAELQQRHQHAESHNSKYNTRAFGNFHRVSNATITTLSGATYSNYIPESESSFCGYVESDA